MVTYERGLNSTVHMFSSPLFLPVGNVPMLADGRLLDYNVRRISTDTSERADATRHQLQHMNNALVPLVHGSRLTWACGTGIYSAHVTVDGAGRGSLSYDLKGESFFTVPDDLTVDVCVPGYHRKDEVVVCSVHGKIFAFNTFLGTLNLVGVVDPMKIRPQGDNAVSFSLDGSRVALQNLHTRQLAIFGYKQCIAQAIEKRAKNDPKGWVLKYNDDAMRLGSPQTGLSQRFPVKEHLLWYMRSLSLRHVLPNRRPAAALLIVEGDSKSESETPVNFDEKNPALVWQVLSLQRVMESQLHAIRSGSSSAIEMWDYDGRTPLHVALLYFSAWFTCALAKYRGLAQNAAACSSAIAPAMQTQEQMRQYERSKHRLREVLRSLLESGVSIYRTDRFGHALVHFLGMNPEIDAAVADVLGTYRKQLLLEQPSIEAKFTLAAADHVEAFPSEGTFYVDGMPTQVVQDASTGAVLMAVPPRDGKGAADSSVQRILEPSNSSTSVAILNVGNDGFIITADGAVACTKEMAGGFSLSSASTVDAGGKANTNSSRQFMTYKHPAPKSWLASEVASISAICTASSDGSSYAFTVAAILCRRRGETGFTLHIRRWSCTSSFVSLSSPSAIAGFISAMIGGLFEPSSDVDVHNVDESSTVVPPQCKVLRGHEVAVLLLTRSHETVIKMYQPNGENNTAAHISTGGSDEKERWILARTFDGTRVIAVRQQTAAGSSTAGPCAVVLDTTGTKVLEVPSRSSASGGVARRISSTAIDGLTGLLATVFEVETTGEYYLLTVLTDRAASRATPLRLQNVDVNRCSSTGGVRLEFGSLQSSGSLGELRLVVCEEGESGALKLQAHVSRQLIGQAHGTISGFGAVERNSPL